MQLNVAEKPVGSWSWKAWVQVLGLLFISCDFGSHKTICAQISSTLKWVLCIHNFMCCSWCNDGLQSIYSHEVWGTSTPLSQTLGVGAYCPKVKWYSLGNRGCFMVGMSLSLVQSKWSPRLISMTRRGKESSLSCLTWMKQQVILVITAKHFMVWFYKHTQP